LLWQGLQKIRAIPDGVLDDKYARGWVGPCSKYRRHVAILQSVHEFAGVSRGADEDMRRRLPLLDQGLAALIEDLYARGLDQRVLVVVTGEFGRTPKINPVNGRPGRDHWPSAMSMLVSGGGMPMGGVIGSTTSKGEQPRDRPLRPTDVLATMYDFLGIDPKQQFLAHSRRPLAIVPDGERIRELLGLSPEVSNFSSNSGFQDR
jgi:hypothetical protein